jgi:hypothetical protein
MEGLRHLGNITGIMEEGETPGFGDWVVSCLARPSWQRLFSHRHPLHGRWCTRILSQSIIRTGRK